MKEKRITMSDIAKKLDLSINAVSLALNGKVGVSEETRKRILAEAEEMGYLDQNDKYTVAYSNKNICILLEHRFFRDMYFYGRVMLGVESAAKEAGYDMLVKSFDEGAEVVPDCVEKKKVSGIIVIGKLSDEYLRRLKDYGLPIVLVDYMSVEESTDCVMTDNKSGTFKMTRYLIEQGFTKIGFFGGMEYSPSVRERFWGYQEGIRKFMNFPDFQSSMEYVETYSSLNKIENYVIHNDAQKIWQAFCDIKERPQVLMCSNDKLAILLCKVLEDMGLRIPEDISVVGFDDIELSKMVSPGLTTVHVYKDLMGRKGVERLIYRMEHPRERAEKIVMNVDLVERNSAKSL